jgi:hypothetical protein
MGERPVAGMHGFDPRDRDSLAFFGSSELLETPPRRLEDLFGLMWDEACRAAGRQACAPAA